jgi:glycosyltransferase involved in cell wall biosynthesis
MSNLTISICIPVYKGSALIKDALDSIFKQNFNNFEIIIGEDTPPRMVNEILKTKKIIDSFNDKRIRYYKNKKNVGSALNIKNIASKSSKDILFFLAQDDILSIKALDIVHDVFYENPEVGVMARPYFWFFDDINAPVRAVLPFNENKNTILSIFDGEKEFMKIFETVGQISGLAYRKIWLDVPFHHECFPGHIYPFAGILKKHKCMFINEYIVAIGIADSQARNISDIYDMSPTESWLRMYKSVFSGARYKQQMVWGIKHICTNYVGLLQLKNYANDGVLFREIKIMLKEYPKNYFSFKFWFFALGTILIPKFILSKLVDWYKLNIIGRVKLKSKINFRK